MNRFFPGMAVAYDLEADNTRYRFSVFAIPRDDDRHIFASGIPELVPHLQVSCAMPGQAGVAAIKVIFPDLEGSVVSVRGYAAYLRTHGFENVDMYTTIALILAVQAIHDYGSAALEKIVTRMEATRNYMKGYKE